MKHLPGMGITQVRWKT